MRIRSDGSLSKGGPGRRRKWGTGQRGKGRGRRIEYQGLRDEVQKTKNRPESKIVLPLRQIYKSI